MNTCKATELSFDLLLKKKKKDLEVFFLNTHMPQNHQNAQLATDFKNV